MLEILLLQPNIQKTDLKKTIAKVLVIAGDEDITINKHSVEMCENIRQAQLCIMLGETHYTPDANPTLFNEIVGRFLNKPFQRPSSKF